ncbi:hypothetical protein A2763_02290 [Candidatus Kaiserbacteria bacterium RIFCSPHIGHO2_01_FULL_54_36]|uniref:Nudix hydrolase domain-containing protein n=1 Tax=Candidatus Kaiserbacteria bacterium RIFCSPHIGHO2_01_FULL_54_36 TaxID=1798482 RepID=A0A1F6CNU3_9BACT|nr:MAG: hypothetical protein A2763_02290 [Candidatus Kaiserbacteria bacterium RIFCSPHIGHO2_01_FULL_54_36]OGG75989.1 MAG: hypothetical protein A3A41_03395 [Candidatus Kaiserbacteria bacterium RIFCSPLOWO2_01_FULL_54_22]
MTIQIVTYAQMLEFLSEGRGPTGRKINLATYDRRSTKTLADLFAEIRGSEVQLHYTSTGRVVRVALGVAIFVTVLRCNARYCEIQREYVRKKRIIPKVKSSTISETRKRGESDVEAAVRGLRQELGLQIRRDQLDTTFTASHWDGRSEFSEHESSVYADILSVTQVQQIGLDLEALPWPEEVRIIDDTGTKVTIQRFPVTTSRSPY